MVYITADGSVDGGRSRSRNPFKLLANLVMGLINGILLFVRTISTPPERLPEVSIWRVRVGLRVCCVCGREPVIVEIKRCELELAGNKKRLIDISDAKREQFHALSPRGEGSAW